MFQFKRLTRGSPYPPPPWRGGKMRDGFGNNRYISVVSFGKNWLCVKRKCHTEPLPIFLLISLKFIRMIPENTLNSLRIGSEKVPSHE